MMKKIRIYELASKLKQKSLDLISVAKILKIDVTSHLSTITSEEQSALEEYYAQNKKSKKKYFSKTIPSTTEQKSVAENNEITPEIKNKIKEVASKVETVDDLVALVNAINRYKFGKNNHLKFKKKQFTYYAFYAKNKYKKFTIPKKSGGQREVLAPVKGLKHILTALNIIFQSVYKSHMVCHGFTQHRSVVTNAKNHIGKNYVYNIDLENFFPNIYQARIWKRLQYPPFNFNLDVANLVSNLVCYQYNTSFSSACEQSVEKDINFLPQGAPTSPILSNIICERLDRKLFKLAKKHNLKYTRYADDMTFSSDHNVYQEDSEFLQKLHKIIDSENFTLNTKKTRLQKRGYKQEVTGLIVNEKINVSRKYIKNLRALIHLIEKYGEEKAQVIFEKLSIKESASNLLYVIHGKLEYLKMVKGFDDSTYKTLANKFEKSIKNEKTEVNANENNIKLKENINSKSCEHNPRELFKILESFTKNNNPLKYATHSWEEGKFESYEDFINQITNEWNKINKDLRKYSKNLHAKIQSFLFNKNLGNKNKKGYIDAWGEYKVRFGWSSPKLKEWCSEGNKPFAYRLEPDMQLTVGSYSIETFDDVCMKVFKHEIEIKTDNNRLEKLFREICKKQLGFDFNVKFENLKGKDFYTDVQWLKSALNKIFEEIKKRTTSPDVNISAQDKDDILEIRIEQIDSKPYKTSKKLLDRKNNGTFGAVANELCSLCDWSVESVCEDGNYRINYLKPKDVKSIEEINEIPKGFTHILRFYK